MLTTITSIAVAVTAVATAAKAIRDYARAPALVHRDEWQAAEAARDEQLRVATSEWASLRDGAAPRRLDSLDDHVRQLRDEITFLRLMNTPRRDQMNPTPATPLVTPKPAWQTPQFWTTAITTVVTMLVVLGYVPAASSDLAVQTALNIVTHVIALVSAGASVWSLASLSVHGPAPVPVPVAPPAPTPPESGGLTDGDLRV